MRVPTTIEAVEPVEYVSEEAFEVGGRVYPNRLIFGYDTTRWNFRAMVAEFFGTDDLEHLHQTHFFDSRCTAKQNSLDVGKSLHTAVSAKSGPLLESLIYDHIASFIGPVKGHQKSAMMRVNFHGSKAILRFHRDREYGQTGDLINLWLPVTAVWGSNSMYVESSSGASDFEPVKLQFGQAFIFRGYDLLHGTLDNDSGSTRITYDLRFNV